MCELAVSRGCGDWLWVIEVGAGVPSVARVRISDFLFWDPCYLGSYVFEVPVGSGFRSMVSLYLDRLGTSAAVAFLLGGLLMPGRSR